MHVGCVPSVAKEHDVSYDRRRFQHQVALAPVRQAKGRTRRVVWFIRGAVYSRTQCWMEARVENAGGYRDM